MKYSLACGVVFWRYEGATWDARHMLLCSTTAKLTASVFWLSISRSRQDFDDNAVGGIFRVTDPKLCFYSYWRASQPFLNGCVRGKGQRHIREGCWCELIEGSLSFKMVQLVLLPWQERESTEEITLGRWTQYVLWKAPNPRQAVWEHNMPFGRLVGP